MSGESPSSFSNDNVFDFKEDPIPTTSKDSANPHQSGVVTASVLIEPHKDLEKDNKGELKEKDKEKEENPASELSSPILNSDLVENSSRESDAEKTMKISDDHDDFDGRADGNKKELSKLMLNGVDGLDLDGQKSPANDKSDIESQEEDSCIVNCLYYTMQCCECRII